MEALSEFAVAPSKMSRDFQRGQCAKAAFLDDTLAIAPQYVRRLFGERLSEKTTEVARLG
jgi:hypothetical protein